VTHRGIREGGRHVIGRSGWLSCKNNVLAILLATFCLVAPCLRADIQFLSDDRHVNVSAFAAAHEGSASDSDSQVAGQLADLHANITANAFWMDKLPNPAGGGPDEADSTATAMQDSILSSIGLDITSFVHVDGGSNLDSDGFPTINADALSFFQVSFSVSAPIVFNLSFFDARGYITAVGSTYEQAFDLTSDKAGSILGDPTIIGDTQFFTGLLQPGQTYTLLLSQHANSVIAAPTGVHVENTLEAHMTFADVPEPSVFVSLAIGLALLVILRTKFARAIPCAARVSDSPASRGARVARLRSTRRPPATTARW